MRLILETYGTSALVHILAWLWTSGKLLPELVMRWRTCAHTISGLHALSWFVNVVLYQHLYYVMINFLGHQLSTLVFSNSMYMNYIYKYLHGCSHPGAAIYYLILRDLGSLINYSNIIKALLCIYVLLLRYSNNTEYEHWLTEHCNLKCLFNSLRPKQNGDTFLTALSNTFH